MLHRLTLEQIEYLGVTFSTFTQDSFENNLYVHGRIDVPPQSLVSLTLPIKSIITSIGVYQGSKVKKGQILATLQHPDFAALQLKYIQALAQEEQIYQEYIRQKGLSQRDIGAKKMFELAQSNYKVALAERSSYEAMLYKVGIDPQVIKEGDVQQSIYLRAPTNGVVKSLPINIGKMSEANEVILELMDDSHLHVELSILESSLDQIYLGQELYFRPVNSNKWFYGSVHMIEATVNPESGLSIVHCHFDDNSSQQLLPGQLVEARVIQGKSFGWKVRSRSLIRANDSVYLILTDQIDNSPYLFTLEPVTIMAELEDFSLVLPLSKDSSQNRFVVDSSAFKVFAALRFRYED